MLRKIRRHLVHHIPLCCGQRMEHRTANKFEFYVCSKCASYRQVLEFCPDLREAVYGPKEPVG